MSARVFISHRPGDGAGAAAALAEELDAMFGDGQVVRIEADAASEERWREALAGTLVGTPILIALVTPEPPAGNGTAGGEALRARLDAGMAAGALILPVLGDGVADLAPTADLPAPFERLSPRPRQLLRNVEWPGDIAELAERLRGLGVRSLVSTQPGTMPLPLHDDGPITMPMAGVEDEAASGMADGNGRRVFGVLAVSLLVVGGWGVWRWRQRRPATLSGHWRAQIGLRGAPSSREGAVMRVTLMQKDRSVSLSSTVAIATDPQWQGVRQAWKERTGSELKQVIYRGQGELVDEDESVAKPAGEPPPGPRQVVLAVQVAAPGASGEKIDEGRFRGVIDPGDQRIRGRLWLESEQAERVFDLWRDD